MTQKRFVFVQIVLFLASVGSLTVGLCLPPQNPLCLWLLATAIVVARCDKFMADTYGRSFR